MVHEVVQHGHHRGSVGGSCPQAGVAGRCLLRIQPAAGRQCCPDFFTRQCGRQLCAGRRRMWGVWLLHSCCMAAATGSGGVCGCYDGGGCAAWIHVVLAVTMGRGRGPTRVELDAKDVAPKMPGFNRGSACTRHGRGTRASRTVSARTGGRDRGAGPTRHTRHPARTAVRARGAHLMWRAAQRREAGQPRTRRGSLGAAWPGELLRRAAAAQRAAHAEPLAGRSPQGPPGPI